MRRFTSNIVYYTSDRRIRVLDGFKQDENGEIVHVGNMRRLHADSNGNIDYEDPGDLMVIPTED